MRKVKNIKALALALAVALSGIAMAAPTFADAGGIEGCACNGNDIANTVVKNVSQCRMYCKTVQYGNDDTDGTKAQSTVKTVLQIVIGIIGILAVIMIILGGIQYTTSAGDTAKVTKAKNTILYGIIGLVIALLAFAIVTWVLGNIG